MQQYKVDRVVAVDWSGNQTKAGQRKGIWAGVWTAKPRGGSAVRLEGGRTRQELIAWLVELAEETPCMVVGVDFCFSYPAWFVEECGAADGMHFWQMVTEELGERWLHAGCDDARFWGRRGPARNGKTPAEFCGVGRDRMFRRADRACKVRGQILDPSAADKVKGIAPKSPFQIGGAGAVGTGTLRGIPLLHTLRQQGFKVWPFEQPELAAGRPLLVEIYPRLLTGAVKKSNAAARRSYLKDKQKKDAAYAALTDDVMKKAAYREDPFDALVSVMEMAASRQDFLALRQATDPTTLLEGAVWGAEESCVTSTDDRVLPAGA